MRYPPYTLSHTAARLVAEIERQLLKITAANSPFPVPFSPQLCRENRIRSIHASLAIENNTLNLEQVTAVVDQKNIVAPMRDIQEVRGAVAAYEKLGTWTPHNMADMLEAHALLMHGLLSCPGNFRTQGVGVFKGSMLAHMAPPAHWVHMHMERLLAWLKNTQMHPLIASSVFHYEFEFIHPFVDGNGRMGRLWQTLILSQWKPLWAYIPVENILRERQEAYYASLRKADVQGEATVFVEFMLLALQEALGHILAMHPTGQQTSSQVPKETSDLPDEQETIQETGQAINEKNEQISEEKAITDQVTDQATDQVSDCVRRLLLALGAQEKSTTQLLQALKLSHAPNFRKVYLNPALHAGLVERTQPNSPQSPTQRYRLSAKGRRMLNEMWEKFLQGWPLPGGA